LYIGIEPNRGDGNAGNGPAGAASTCVDNPSGAHPAECLAEAAP